MILATIVATTRARTTPPVSNDSAKSCAAVVVTATGIGAGASRRAGSGVEQAIADMARAIPAATIDGYLHGVNHFPRARSSIAPLTSTSTRAIVC